MSRCDCAEDYAGLLCQRRVPWLQLPAPRAAGPAAERISVSEVPERVLPGEGLEPGSWAHALLLPAGGTREIVVEMTRECAPYHGGMKACCMASVDA